MCFTRLISNRVTAFCVTSSRTVTDIYVISGVKNFPFREEKKMIIRNKYEKRQYCVVTTSDLDIRRADLKQAIHTKDPYALLQVFAEGIDFMEPLPEMVCDDFCDRRHISLTILDATS